MLITKRKIIIDKVRKNILQPCCKLQGGALVSAAPTKQTVQTIGGYGIPAIPTQLQNYLPTEPTEVSDARYSPTEPTEHTETTGARYSPTDCTDVHRLGVYGILPYPRSHRTIFPQKPQNPQKLLTQDILPQNTQNTQKRLAQGILPQIADIHRLGGYGIPAIPTQPTKLSSHRTLSSLTICVHLCASVGGSSTPEASVNSVNSVGEPYAA